MPSAPEFLNALGNIRVIKVFLEVKAEHCSKTDSHIRITGEIEIDLEGIAYYYHPASRNGGLNSVEGLKILCHGKYSISKKHLFCKTCAKTADTFRKFIHAMFTGDKLIVNITVSDDGARNKLGEECYVGTERHEITLNCGVSTIKINGI